MRVPVTPEVKIEGNLVVVQLGIDRLEMSQSEAVKLRDQLSGTISALFRAR